MVSKNVTKEQVFRERVQLITVKQRLAVSPRLSHFPKLHLRVWMEGPLQGLLVASHDLPLCWVPVPHVTVHSVHSDQGDQPSSLSLAAHT